MGHKRAAYEIPKEIRAQIDNLKEEKLKFYHSDPRRRFASEKEAKKFERQLFLTILEKRQEAVQNESRRLQHQIAGPPSRQLRLDGSVESQPYQMNLQAAEWQKRVEALKVELDKIARDLAALKNNESDYFVWDIAFVEILAGEKQGFDIVIGNPPYVRQENICNPSLARDAVTKENKQAYKAKLANSVYQAFPQFFGYKPATGHVAYKLDGKSDLYIYFYFYALSLLNSKGAFCFITSNSWLDVGYGAELQEFLLKHCHVKMILDNQVQRSFYQADVNTVIVLFSSPDETREWGLEQTARFVMFKQPFENVLSSSVFQEIAATNERRTMPTFRIHPISQRAILTAGCEEQNVDGVKQSVKNKIHSADKAQGPLIKIERYLGDKWGGKYLRAPDIYWTILKKGQGKLVRLGDIADVRFGIKTGANEFFYLNEARIRKWGIEKEFLKSVIKSPRECKRILIDPKDLKYKIFMCHKDKKDLNGTSALEYIKWGESQRFHNRPSCAGRAKWWDLGMQGPFDFVVLRFRDKRNWNPINETSSLLAGDIMFVGTWHDRSSVTTNNALANSTLSVLISEIYGRVNLGDGLLTTYGPEILIFDFIKASEFNKAQNQKIFEKMEALGKREVKSILDEVKQLDRRSLDNIILDVLDLTQGEKDAAYEAVIYLVESRLKKAESLKSKNRHEHKDDEEIETNDFQIR